MVQLFLIFLDIQRLEMKNFPKVLQENEKPQTLKNKFAISDEVIQEIANFAIGAVTSNFIGSRCTKCGAI